MNAVPVDLKDMSPHMKDLWRRLFLVGQSIGLTEHNLLKMQQRGGVPPKHHKAMLEAAKLIGVPLSLDEIPP